MNTVDVEQGSHEWFECRLGCVTSSRIADVVAKRKRVKEGKPEELACRASLRWELVGEFLSGEASEHYVSKYMREGKEKEPLARGEYEAQLDLTVEQVGFVYHPEIKFAGASPDGLIYSRTEPIGVIEIKCPKIETHLQYLAADVIPDDYLPQMVWQLACGPELQWADFVSYHPAMKAPYRLFRKRMPRTKEVNDVISAYELEAVQFLKEVNDQVEQLKQRYTVAA